MSMRLEAAGVESLTLDRDDGWVIRGFDVGDPQPRPVVQLVPGGHGASDSTMLEGQRTVTLHLRLIPSGYPLWWMRNRLRQFTAAATRSSLFFTPEGEASELRIAGLRRSQFTDPNTNPISRDVSVQWVTDGPPVIESAVLESFTVFPGASGGGVGVEFELELPVEFVGGDPPGSTLVTNLGTFEALPVLKVFGPAEGIVVENRTVGRALVFASDFEVQAGEYLEVDTRLKTVRLNGLANQSRYDELDFEGSEWWGLVPGVNDVRFTAVSSGSPAQLQGVFRHAWI